MKEIPVVCIPGDGIGPEITDAMKSVVAKATEGSELKIEWEDVRVGISAIEAGEELLPPSVLERIREKKFAIKGPTATPVGGGHRSVNVALRQQLDLYANIRPIRWFSGIDTPIKRPENVNLTIFRENTEDVYAGIEYAAGSDEAKSLHSFLKLEKSISSESALGLKPVSEVASRRLMNKAVEFVKCRGHKRISIVHKGNIMKFTEGAFCEWAFDEAKSQLGDAFLLREDFDQNGKGEIPEGKILVQDKIADAMFQDLLLKPEDHEVIVTLNLNGDYLSDAAAALVGGLGLAPGANVRDDVVLFEAVHGTAPDIAGKDLANPSALILSACLLIEHVGYQGIADRIHQAVATAIEENTVTGDLYSSDRNGEKLTCSAYASRLCELLA